MGSGFTHERDEAGATLRSCLPYELLIRRGDFDAAVLHRLLAPFMGRAARALSVVELLIKAPCSPRQNEQSQDIFQSGKFELVTRGIMRITNEEHPVNNSPLLELCYTGGPGHLRTIAEEVKGLGAVLDSRQDIVERYPYVVGFTHQDFARLAARYLGMELHPLALGGSSQDTSVEFISTYHAVARDITKKPFEPAIPYAAILPTQEFIENLKGLNDPNVVRLRRERRAQEAQRG